MDCQRVKRLLKTTLMNLAACFGIQTLRNIMQWDTCPDDGQKNTREREVILRMEVRHSDRVLLD